MSPPKDAITQTETWGAIHSTKMQTGPTGKRGPSQKVDQFFRNFSGWTEPIHWVLDRNVRKFWLNGSRPWSYNYLKTFGSRFRRGLSPGPPAQNFSALPTELKKSWGIEMGWGGVRVEWGCSIVTGWRAVKGTQTKTELCHVSDRHSMYLEDH